MSSSYRNVVAGGVDFPIVFYLITLETHAENQFIEICHQNSKFYLRVGLPKEPFLQVKLRLRHSIYKFAGE